MSIAEIESREFDRITTPFGAAPEEIASMVPIPEPEIFQAYLHMRFGSTVLQLSLADQAELYQMDVSGACNKPPVFDPPIEVNWAILREG